MSIYEEISKKMDELHEKIRPDNINEWFDDVKRTMHMFLEGEKISQFRKTLEYVVDDLKGDSGSEDQLKKVYGLLNTLKAVEPDFLIERLKNRGREIANKKIGLRESINKEALRLLEQTRLGKRDTVIGMLLRDFIINQERFHTELIEASKAKYDINLFRSFIYAFLSNFTTEKTKEDYSNE